MPTKNKKKIANDFINWSLTFTKKIILIITVAWVIYMTYAAFLITIAIFITNDFSYLDTFISENSETFRLVVGVNLVSKTIENVFAHNNGGWLGTSINSPEGDPK